MWIQNISGNVFPIPISIASKKRHATNFPLRQLISLMYLEQRDILNINYLFKICLYSLKKKHIKSCVCLHWKVRTFLKSWGKAQFKNYFTGERSVYFRVTEDGDVENSSVVFNECERKLLWLIFPWIIKVENSEKHQ